MKSLIAYAVALSLAAPVFAQDRRDEVRHDAPPPHHFDPHDHHTWARGNKLPPEYRRQDFVVNDWQARHLRRPPRGYHWVRADNDYVLAAVATGVIADIILNH